jgi:hypothetical protein
MLVLVGGSVALAIAQGKIEFQTAKPLAELVVLKCITSLMLVYVRFSDDVKSVITACLQRDPSSRPTIDQLIATVAEFAKK